MIEILEIVDPDLDPGLMIAETIDVSNLVENIVVILEMKDRDINIVKEISTETTAPEIATTETKETTETFNKKTIDTTTTTVTIVTATKNPIEEKKIMKERKEDP